MIIRTLATCQVMAKELRAVGGASGSEFSITVANFCVRQLRESEDSFWLTVPEV